MTSPYCIISLSFRAKVFWNECHSSCLHVRHRMGHHGTSLWRVGRDSNWDSSNFNFNSDKLISGCRHVSGEPGYGVGNITVKVMNKDGTMLPGEITKELGYVSTLNRFLMLQWNEDYHFHYVTKQAVAPNTCHSFDSCQCTSNKVCKLAQRVALLQTMVKTTVFMCCECNIDWDAVLRKWMSAPDAYAYSALRINALLLVTGSNRWY